MNDELAHVTRIGTFRARTSLALLSALVGAVPAVSPGQARGAEQSGADLFTFQSGFWMNLHHFLYVTARAANGEPDSRSAAVAGALSDTAGFGSLSASARSGWEQAMRFYRDWPGRMDILFDAAMVAHKRRIRTVADSGDVHGAGLPAGLAGALADAAPAYRALWWPRHDAANRAFREQVDPLLHRWGEEVAKFVTAAYDTVWQGPVPVDLVAYANWAGAYTTTRPTHVIVSTLAPIGGPLYAFESLFHEAMHGFDTKVSRALARESRLQGKQIGDRLWHAILFYTAGAAVRGVAPDHVPTAERSGVFRRGDNPILVPLVEAHWAPHLRGEFGIAEAIRRIVAAHP